MDACASSVIPNARISFVLSNRKAAYGLVRAASASPPIPTDYIALQPFLKGRAGRTREDYDLEVARRVLVQGEKKREGWVETLSGSGLETETDVEKEKEKDTDTEVEVDIDIDLIVLAGWMHVLSSAFLDAINGNRPYSSSSSPNSPNSTNPTTTKIKKRVRKPIPIINLHPALPGAFDGANAIERAFAAGQRGEIDRTGVMVHYVVREVDRGAPIVVREVEIREGEGLEGLEGRIHEVEHGILVEAVGKVLGGV